MDYWALLLALCVRPTFGYNILCLLPYPGKSHHMVFEPLLQELVNRGHHLTVVSFFPTESPHRSRRDVSLVGLAPISVEVVDMSEFDHSYLGLARYIEHIFVATKIAQMNLELCEKILDADVFKEFVNAEGDYDVILVEHFNSDCMLGIIHKYGLPSVGLMSCAVMPFTPYRVGAPENPSYVPGMTLPLTDKMTFLERLENTVMLYFYALWFEVAIRWKEQRLLEKKLGQSLPPLEELGKNASVVLVHMHHSVNGVRVHPPSIVEVGGLHLHNRSVQPLPSELEQWVSEAQSGFILFSFGSLIKGSTLPEKQLRALVRVFAGLPQRVVWKWEGERFGVPDNVRLIKWLPQYDLLMHPNCVGFITHCGGLSLTEAAAAGVPMLAVPMLGDQFGNAANAARVGLAKVVPLRDWDESTLKTALKEVLGTKMRNQAKRLSEIWHDKPMSPMDRAVFYVEKTARYGGLELSTHGRLLNRAQLMLLDLVAFLLIALISVFLAITWICRNCFRCKNKIE